MRRDSSVLNCQRYAPVWVGGRIKGKARRGARDWCLNGMNYLAGISISGGSASRAQPEIRIEKVFPGGAADDDGTLQVHK